MLAHRTHSFHPHTRGVYRVCIRGGGGDSWGHLRPCLPRVVSHLLELPPWVATVMKRALLHLLSSRGSSAGQWYQDHLRLHLPSPPLCADSQTHPGRSVRTVASFSCGLDLMTLLLGETTVSKVRPGWVTTNGHTKSHDSCEPALKDC